MFDLTDRTSDLARGNIEFLLVRDAGFLNLLDDTRFTNAVTTV